MHQPDHIETINAMIAEIDGQPTSAAGERMKTILLILRDMWMSNSAYAEAMIAQGKRLAVLEEQLERMQGDGR